LRYHLVMQCVRCGLINSPESKRCDCGQTLGAPKEKDWNERFERAEAKPPYWRVFIGAILIVGRIGQFVSPGDNLIQPTDTAARLGSYFGSAVVLAGASWLIYSGFKPRRVKIPRD